LAKLKIFYQSVYNATEDNNMPDKTVKDICGIHGEQDFALENYGTKNQRKRCKKCRSEAVQRRREKLKEKAVEYKGSCCEKCGYSKCISALEFHHLDPAQKDFGISAYGHTYAWKKIKLELDKCILICANCHREAHDKKSLRIKKIVSKTCPICSKNFEDGGSNKKVYCSSKCSNKRKNLSRKKKKKNS